MQLSVILLFLQLWGIVEVSLSQNVCSKLPDVPHAHVSEETKKAEYQETDVIHFTCEPGYISDQTSKYVCTREGWLTISQGTCYSCSTLPDVPHAHISEETKKADYQEGDVIHFTCEPGYTSGPTIKYVCTSGGWLAVRQGTCFFPASSCEPPPADGGVTVKGLPQNEEPILPDQFLTFSCGPGKYLDGSSVLICGKDGQWNNPFPSCEDITCKVGVMHPHLYVAGLPRANETMKTGHKLRFQCSDQYTLYGSEEIECLQTGQWNTLFPTCADKCKVTDVPANVYIPVYVPNNQLRKGQKLRFECRQRGHFLRGNASVECLANGQWSDPFPTCGPPLGCRRPPPLTDGDIKDSVLFQYRHEDRVEYVCPNLYIMQGGPYKTCKNGEWVGQIRCLKPCTVDKEAMRSHNIVFRYTADDKLYSTHNDVIQFMCTRGRTHDGVKEMRPKCVDGVMLLPTCQ
ncbi:complement factor H-related protein 1-like isoform X2 [Micropterus dolomieu]|uniref:complement factor H-related protein 1-like isoform X2 n=1 Tax=Micropterus dolomieu TaxID=147949 RepID=UPI001E8E817F|nr:complement factor H-related protein 1-like isoform X2 [Micropterus dolomieu]